MRPLYLLPTVCMQPVRARGHTKTWLPRVRCAFFARARDRAPHQPPAIRLCFGARESKRNNPRESLLLARKSLLNVLVLVLVLRAKWSRHRQKTRFFDVVLRKNILFHGRSRTAGMLV